MCHHDWSEKDFDWEGLDDACKIVRNNCLRYGRLGGIVKEKWGCLQFSVWFGRLSLHNLVYPGYVYNQFPEWLWKLDNNVISPVMQFFFERPFVWWQKKVYNWAYQKAIKSHPHLREEILCDADFPEWIEGGTEVHNKYWKSIEDS